MTDAEMAGSGRGLTDAEMAGPVPETDGERKLREGFLTPGHRKPALHNTGPIAQVRAELDPGQLENPVATVAGAGNSAVDRYSLGLYGAALRSADKLDELTGTSDSIAGQTAHGIDEYRQRHPIASQITDAPAYFVDGPVSALTTAIGKGAERAFNSPILRAAGTSALTSLGIGGAQAATAGMSPQDILGMSLEAGGAGGLMGGGLAVGGRGLGLLGRAVENSRGGQARQFLEEHGATVRPGGVDLPGEYVTRGTSDADIGQQAEASAGKGLEMLRAEKRAQVSNPYARALARIQGESQAVPEPIEAGNETTPVPHEPMSHMIGEAPASEEPVSRPPSAEEAAFADRGRRPTQQIPVQSMAELAGEGAHEVAPADIVSEAPTGMRDVRPVYSKLVEAYYDPGTDPAIAAKIKHVMGIMDERYTRPDSSILMTEEQLNGLRRQLSRTSKAGISTDEKLSPLQQATSITKGMVDEGPYAEANAAYAEGSKRFQQSRKLLGINERPKTPDESKAAVSTVKNLITRRGQNTVTAGGQEGRLAEFEQRHPDIAEEFIKPEMLRKHGDISFRAIPQHGGLIERSGGGYAPGQVAYHMLRHPFATIGSLGATNMAALSARLLYGPALAAKAAAPLLLQDIPLLQAARNAHREERP